MTDPQPSLRGALERLLTNAEHIFDKKPVRDWAETLAEARAALAASPAPAADGLDVAALRNLARSIRSSDLFRRQQRSLLDSEKPTWSQIVALVDAAAYLHEPSREPGEEG